MVRLGCPPHERSAVTISISEDRCPRDNVQLGSYWQPRNPKWATLVLEIAPTRAKRFQAFAPLVLPRAVLIKPNSRSLESTSHPGKRNRYIDRKSTRLNSSHLGTSS